jgi:ergothioneine biosynthesis protein EgtB
MNEKSSTIGLDSTAAAGVLHALHDRYRAVRRFTEKLCQPLSPEDCVIQSMPDASPTRWHAAHTTWFFETFVLLRALEEYRPFHPAFSYLFNSYYNSIGQQFPRAERGLLSRPTMAEVLQYRAAVDAAMEDLFQKSPEKLLPLAAVVELGLNHEEQHQELILTDLKHLLSRNPLFPAYRESAARPTAPETPLRWTAYRKGLRKIGHGGAGFAFDNESPRHQVFLEPYELASRLATNREYLEFLEDGGYRRPELWLSAGWQELQRSGWKSPLYWLKQGGRWHQFTLSGLEPLAPDEPVSHLSYFEADAFARWVGCRLPTEAEWEVAAEESAVEGNFVERGLLRPSAAPEGPEDDPLQLFGDLWEWTSSAYTAYPGYRPAPGALGEYNGKFMCNQFVLRGGSCATPAAHIRRTYRNFFPPEARWQFSGVRLAR